MRIFCIPVVILGIALTFIGLETLFAPEVFILANSNEEAFELFGRIPTGLAAAIAGLLMLKEGLRGAHHFVGLFMGVVVSVFFSAATLLPAWLGNKFIDVGPFVLRGYVSGITAVMWLSLAFLCGYYYIHLRYHR